MYSLVPQLPVWETAVEIQFLESLALLRYVQLFIHRILGLQGTFKFQEQKNVTWLYWGSSSFCRASGS